MDRVLTRRGGGAEWPCCLVSLRQLVDGGLGYVCSSRVRGIMQSS